jgi:ubiquinone/menaquinone biosynthesis C-methylase UbiE
VRKRYDLTAEMYDSRYTEEQEAKYYAALTSMQPTGLVLDVGCGTGLLFNHVASQSEQVVGVDISKKLLLQAKERVDKPRNVELVQADADHLPFKNGLFNAVFAFTVLQNMPKPNETLMEIRRSAVRGACVVVTGLKKVFSTEALTNLLDDAGFHVDSVKDEGNLKCYVALGCKSGKFDRFSLL